MSNVPEAPRSREEDRDLTWDEFVQVFLVFEDLYDKDYSELTMRKWHDTITDRMGAELFQVTANVWIEKRKWMPKLPEFIRLAGKIEDAQRKMEQKELAEARAEAEKRKIEREARRNLPDPLRRGKAVAKAVQAGDFDIDAAFGRALPADVEESYRKADDTTEE